MALDVSLAACSCELKGDSRDDSVGPCANSVERMGLAEEEEHCSE